MYIRAEQTDLNKRYFKYIKTNSNSIFNTLFHMFRYADTVKHTNFQTKTKNKNENKIKTKRNVLIKKY